MQNSLKLMAAAAVPIALIALGASLHRDEQPGTAPRAEICAISTLKLLAQPLLAYTIGLLLHLSQPQLLVVVVCAGLPTAQNTFIFAQQYGVAQALSGRAVVITTTLSLATLATAAALLS